MWIQSFFEVIPPLCYVVAGASLGALARYAFTTFALGGWVGIALVNVLGCLLFGVLYGLCLKRGFSVQQHPLALLGLTGFCGAFTTFSSYVFNLHTLWHEGQLLILLINMLGQHVLGVVFFGVGVWIMYKIS